MRRALCHAYEMATLLNLTLPIFIAALGLAGVFGASLLSARSALRVRVYDTNKAEADEFGRFRAEIVSAHDEQLAAYLNLLGELRQARMIALSESEDDSSVAHVFEHSSESMSRIENARTAWRAARAKSHIFMDQPLNDALAELESRRNAVVRALNSGDDVASTLELDKMRNQEGLQLFRHLQVADFRRAKALSEILTVVRLRRNLKGLTRIHAHNIAKTLESIESNREVPADPSV